MKYIYSAVLAILISVATFGQNDIPVSFDERMELVGTVFHLAGAPEYNSIMVPAYEASLDSAMAAVKTHPAVELATQYRTEHGISYDAVASYAIHLKFAPDSTLVFDDTHMVDSDTSLDRWPGDTKTKFLEALNDFYVKSHFNDWYESTADLRHEAVEAFETVGMVDTKWFDTFFEQREGAQFKIILSILAGPGNYGCSAKLNDGTDLITPIIGCCEAAQEGSIFYRTGSVLPTVVHEFCHSYVNPLDAKYWDLMKKKAAKIYRPLKKDLMRQAYADPETMINESLVRAAVICYMTDHYGDAGVDDMIYKEETRSFVLTRRLVNSLKFRQHNLKEYPTMDDYMPKLAKDINHFSMWKYKRSLRIAAKQLVHFTCDTKNGAKLPAGEFEFTIRFDRPMGNTVSVNHVSNEYPLPQAERYYWSDDQKTQTLVFILEPGRQYGVRVLGTSYHGLDGKRGYKDVDITFKTK